MYMLCCQCSGGEDTRNPSSRPILEPSKGGSSTHRAVAAHAHSSVRLRTVRDQCLVHAAQRHIPHPAPAVWPCCYGASRTGQRRPHHSAADIDLRRSVWVRVGVPSHCERAVAAIPPCAPKPQTAPPAYSPLTRCHRIPQCAAALPLDVLVRYVRAVSCVLLHWVLRARPRAVKHREELLLVSRDAPPSLFFQQHNQTTIALFRVCLRTCHVHAPAVSGCFV